MTSCCTSTVKQTRRSQKKSCPLSHNVCVSVAINTVLHHLKKPWQWQLKDQNYYFCDEPACEVVYFAQDGSLIKQNELRTPVGLKSSSVNALLCYCFGITAREAAADSQLKQFVIEKTSNNQCACSILNPSGRCCLKEFPES